MLKITYQYVLYLELCEAHRKVLNENCASLQAFYFSTCPTRVFIFEMCCLLEMLYHIQSLFVIKSFLHSKQNVMISYYQ